VSKISRLQSFKYAFEGIWYALRTQRNAQIHCGIALAMLGLGLMLSLPPIEWAVLALTTGFVFATELMNTAVESAMDFATTEPHPQIKIVKDVAAGAVLIAAITAVVVGLLILGPPLLAVFLRWLA
jgi:diacylglycerol kinase